MASLTIRNIDDSLKASLGMRAAANQRSMEEEARQILKRFLLQKKCAEGIGIRIAKRFSEDGVRGTMLASRNRKYLQKQCSNWR